MKVLVTGGAGFVGSHVVEALLRRGDAVVALDAFDPYYDPAVKRRTAAALERRGARVLEGDVRDPQAVAFALAGVDRVVHLAARPGVRASLDDPAATFDINVRGLLVLLEALRRAPRPLVSASSSSVYGGDARPPFHEDQPASRPLSPYAASKRAAEHLCATYAHLFGVGSIALRFFTVYGPRGRPDMSVGRFARAALTGEPAPLHGEGDVMRDFTYVDDIVAGVLRALDLVTPGGGHEVLNLGGGEVHTVRELIAAVEAAAGAPVPLIPRPAAPGDMTVTRADLTRARARLGFAPRVPLAEGVRRTVAWMRRDLAP
ncbi:MAG: NAD-dependent epimerase/dehydratase family protein [Planctomycetes bacterium]|nr:NAD-dependent epimerase/dehydratase family protein [Planctomycetota bacterium]